MEETMVRLLKFSSAGHDVMRLSLEDAREEAEDFTSSMKGRLVDTKTNKIIKDASAIKDDSEILLLNQLAGG